MKYCDIEYLNTFIEIKAEDEPKFTTLIGIATSIMDSYTGRKLVTDTEETRTFSNKFNNVNEVLIDECNAVTNVEVDDVDVDFIALPANRERKNSIYSSDLFSEGYGNIKVTAKFAKYIGTVPDNLQYVCAWIVIGLNNFATSNHLESEIKSEKIGDYTVTYKDTEQYNSFITAQALLKAEKLKGRV